MTLLSILFMIKHDLFVFLILNETFFWGNYQEYTTPTVGFRPI